MTKTTHSGVLLHRFIYLYEMDIVNQILEREQKKAEKYKPITVEKHLELEFDVGTLLAFDSNDLDTKSLR